jgi:hypothetical protein
VVDVVDVNYKQRKLLEEGVEIAESTMVMLEKYRPCINAYKVIYNLINRDSDKLHAVLDDADFLDALYTHGGQNIRTIVRIIMELVP